MKNKMSVLALVMAVSLGAHADEEQLTEQEKIAQLSRHYSTLKQRNDILRLELENVTLKKELDDTESVDRDKKIAEQNSQIKDLENQAADLAAQLEKSAGKIKALETQTDEAVVLAAVERVALVRINGLRATPTAKVVVDGVAEKQISVGDEIVPGVYAVKITGQSMHVEEGGRSIELLLRAYPQAKYNGSRKVSSTVSGGSDSTGDTATNRNKTVREIFNAVGPSADKKTMPKLQSGKSLEFYQEF